MLALLRRLFFWIIQLIKTRHAYNPTLFKVVSTFLRNVMMLFSQFGKRIVLKNDLLYNYHVAMEGDGMSIIKNVNIVLKYIDEHLEETLTVKKLAKVAGYSEYHFIRVFKECMNITIMEYVCKRRLMKASEDILLGEKIIDVAVKYGWQSHSGFTKAFKKEFGFSPSLLRAMKFSVENLGGSAMSHEFLGTTKVGATKEELFAILQNKMKLNGVYVERNRLIKIYRTACSAYENVKRYSGEEYVTHLLNVSIVLAEIDATANVILCVVKFLQILNFRMVWLKLD